MNRFAIVFSLALSVGCSADRAPFRAPTAGPPASLVAEAVTGDAVASSASRAVPEPAPETTFVTGTILTGLSATLDGDLAEWTSAPSVRVEAADGAVTELWIAASGTGIVMAARGDTRALRVELSSPPGKFPAIGYANQFGEQVVGPETCAAPMQDGSPSPNADACHKWYASARARHDELLSWFTRTVQVDGDHVLVQGDPEGTTLRRSEGTLELSLSARAFPLTDLAPLSTLSVRVWVGSASVDAGPLALDFAIPFGDPPNLLQSIIADGGNGDRLVFYQPGPTVDHVAVAFNKPMGYQFEPTEPSPFIGQIRLDKRKVLFKRDGRELLELPRDYAIPGELPGYAWKNADGTLELLPYVSQWGDGAVAAVSRKAGVDLLFASEQMQSLLGAGACGACSIGVMRVVRITDAGAEEIVEEYAAPGTGEPVKVTADRRGRGLSSSFACGGEVPTTVEVVFDPKSETYERRAKGGDPACAY